MPIPSLISVLIIVNIYPFQALCLDQPVVFLRISHLFVSYLLRRVSGITFIRDIVSNSDQLSSPLYTTSHIRHSSHSILHNTKNVHIYI